jgi:hypothetical protein
MTNRYYTLLMRSNNVDLEVVDRLEAVDVAAAVTQAKATLTTLKAISGIPPDLRIKLLQFAGDVPIVEPLP